MLVHGFTQALQRGKPTGKRGEINVSAIDTTTLETLLQQSEEVTPKFPEVQRLIQTATLALEIRRALKYKDMYRLQEIIDEITDDSLSVNNYDDNQNRSDDRNTSMIESERALIVDEIAVARAELDNQYAVDILTTAIQSFEDTENRALDISFINDPSATTATGKYTNSNENSRYSSGHQTPKASSRGRTSSMLGISRTGRVNSILEGLSTATNTSISSSIPMIVPIPSSSRIQGIKSERRYSFANKYSTNIDPESIDVEQLDASLRVAEDHGIYSEQAARLYRTVKI